jgi:predicted O-methyltransferase YrrM
MKLKTKRDVLEGLSAYVVSAGLAAALEAGLFWRLAEQPLDAEGVAEALNIPLKRCRYWLEILEDLGLVERTGAGYAPSDDGRAAILETYSRESWAYLAHDEMARLPGVAGLPQHIHEPGPTPTAPPNYVQRLRSDPAEARRFTRMLHELHQALAEHLAQALDLTGVRRLLDVGGGSGVVSLRLLRDHPQLTATVVDQENVCAAGREIAAEASLADRITYQAADFLRDELPGGFDLALHCDLGLCRDELFRREWAALNAGGQLALVEAFAPREHAAPAGRLFWTFSDSLADPEVEYPTLAAAQDQLRQAGFRSITVQPVPGSVRVVVRARKD